MTLRCHQQKGIFSIIFQNLLFSVTLQVEGIINYQNVSKIESILCISFCHTSGFLFSTPLVMMNFIFGHFKQNSCYFYTCFCTFFTFQISIMMDIYIKQDLGDKIESQKTKFPIEFQLHKVLLMFSDLCIIHSFCK